MPVGLLSLATGTSIVGALQLVADGGELAQSTSNLTGAVGGALRTQGRIRKNTGYQGANFIQIVLPGYYWGGGGPETPIPNAMSVQVALEFPNAPTTTVVQGLFGGSPVGSIPIGAAEYICDQILPSSFGFGSTFPPNTVFYYKYQVDIANGGLGLNEFGRGLIDPDCSELTGSQAAYASQITVPGPLSSGGASFTGNGGNPANRTFGALAFIGTVNAPMISVLACAGDSIEQGAGGTAFPNMASGGWFANALVGVNGANIPWTDIARYGSTAAGYQGGANLMKALYKYATFALTEDATNGSSASSEFTALTSIWPDLKAHSGSTITHVEHSLCLARASTTDNYATVGNQAQSNASLQGPFNTSVIGSVGSNGLDNYFDMPASFISPPSPWTSGGASSAACVFPADGVAFAPTADGTHPTDYLARSVMAPALKVRALSWLQTKVTAAPVNVTAPFIIGARYQGSTLAVLNPAGTWSVGASLYNSLSYQWKRSGTNISGATGQTYTLVSGDVGATITCTVTATNGSGSTPATTAATATVLAVGITIPSFPAASPIVSSQTTITSNIANVTQTGGQTDPLGGTTATKVAYSSSANNQKVVLFPGTVLNGQQVTCSIYGKAVEYQYLYLLTGSQFTVYSYIFDVLNGLVVSGNIANPAPAENAVPNEVGIIQEPNGWWRCYITHTAIGQITSSGSAAWFGPMATNSGNTGSPGAGTTGSGILVWRLQTAPGGIDS